MQGSILLFFDISGGELLVIMIGVFLIFGPKKMPEIARKIGRTMNELKKASSDITKEFRDETSAIKDEILAARESIRRETDIIKKDISETSAKVEQNLSTQSLDNSINPDNDPYGLNKKASAGTEAGEYKSQAEGNDPYKLKNEETAKTGDEPINS